MSNNPVEYYEHNTLSWMEPGCSWNPMTGCTKYSEACQNCYGESMCEGYKPLWLPQDDPFKFTIHDGNQDTPVHPDRFNPKWSNHPSRTKEPSRFFVVDTGDIFNEEAPFEIIERIFNTMVEVNQHLYLVLTKRSERMRELAPRLPWPDNIVAGVTVELPKYYHRIDDLGAVPAAIKMIMAEPLLSFLPDIPLDGIDQVVCGGESVKPGFKPRLPDPDWVRSLRDQCLNAKVAFMFKQWGGYSNTKKKHGCVLDGEIWNQWPEQIMAWHEARGFEKAHEE
jgi:protein gp37